MAMTRARRADHDSTQHVSTIAELITAATIVKPRDTASSSRDTVTTLVLPQDDIKVKTNR